MSKLTQQRPAMSWLSLASCDVENPALLVSLLHFGGPSLGISVFVIHVCHSSSHILVMHVGCFKSGVFPRLSTQTADTRVGFETWRSQKLETALDAGDAFACLDGKQFLQSDSHPEFRAFQPCGRTCFRLIASMPHQPRSCRQSHSRARLFSGIFSKSLSVATGVTAKQDQEILDTLHSSGFVCSLSLCTKFCTLHSLQHWVEPPRLLTSAPQILGIRL